MRTHVLYQWCDPLDGLLGATREICRRGLWPNQHGEVGETADQQPEVGDRAVGPLLAQRAATAAAYVDAIKRAGEGIKPRGINDDVEFKFAR